MIDEKKIEEAAIKHTFKEYERLYDHIDDVMINEVSETSFKAGINWFLDNLWHDASEKPQEEKKLIVEMIDKEYHSAYYINKWFYISDVNNECEVSTKVNNIARWLYIDDLLKGGSHE